MSSAKGVSVVFVERANAPERLVCEAEVVFGDDQGPLAGLKLNGFSLWRGEDSGEVYVTVPSRAFGVGRERKYYDYLRSIDGTSAPVKRLKAWILEAFKAQAPHLQRREEVKK